MKLGDSERAAVAKRFRSESYPLRACAVAAGFASQFGLKLCSLSETAFAGPLASRNGTQQGAVFGMRFESVHKP